MTISLEPPAVVAQLLDEASRLGFSQSCDPRTGALLRLLAASKPGGRFLNLGTGVGVSSAWLLDGMNANAELWTVDIDAERSRVAKTHLDERLRIVVEDAATFMQGALAADKRFDLIFADAIPGKYKNLDLALNLVAPAGFYVVDDMPPKDEWPGALILMDHIAADPRFTTLKLDWATGHFLAVRSLDLT
ncbi:MAG: O-methyltransferase [Geminicoccaceae bacterium]